MKKCLCVFSRILGWSVFGRYVDAAFASRSSQFAFTYLNYDDAALRRHVPWYWNIGDARRTHYRLKAMATASDVVASNFDAVVFQGHDLAIPFRRSLDRPTGIIADTTPAITKRRARPFAGVRSFTKRIWCELQDRVFFRPLFARVSAFLVLSDFVKESLQRDYGVELSKIFTVGPPIYEQIAAIGTRRQSERPVMLFVGNDFKRKGGLFLLDLYRAYFTENADLWIVSNGVGDAALPPGVRVFANLPHAEVLALMLQSHVFVFPSLHDELGLVLAEAACAGLPIVARQSGGQAEYVQHGENGYLMPHDADALAWRDAIGSILASTEVQQRFSTNSRALGKRLCTRARFEQQVAGFLTNLESAPQAPTSRS